MDEEHDLVPLLAEAGWLRALARRLVADAAAADDLAQDAWVVALRHRPSSDRPLRAWLATILRRGARDRRLAEERRACREREAARREAVPAADDVVLRAEAQRCLVEAVLELPEPYRTTVLWRWFEDLPPREIARRAGVPVATVESRLRRGLAQLRARLDRRAEGRGAWLTLVLPLATRAPRGGLFPLGAIPMQISSKLAVAAAAATLAAFAWWILPVVPGRAAEREIALAPAADRFAAGAPATVLAAAPEPGRATRALAAEPPSPASPHATEREVEAARPLRGRVLDAAGRGLGGVRLAASRGAITGTYVESGRGGSPRETCRSGSGGWFELAATDADAVLDDDERFATVLAAHARARTQATPVVVVAPAIALAGRVVDEQGAALEGALVEVRLPTSFGADFGVPLDWSLRRAWRVRSGADGAYELSEVPAVAGANVVAELGGYVARAVELPAASDRALDLVLERPRAEHGIVRGVVVDELGAPVRGARVSAGPESARSDEQGRFALDVTREGTRAPIRAVRRGHLPAEWSPPEPAPPSLWPAFVVLRLGGPPRSIEGVVTDARGAPLAGARVWVADPTLVSFANGMAVHAETLAARDDEAFWAWVQSDATGAFRIDGLAPREYEVAAIDPATLAKTRVGAVPGERVLLRLPTDDVHEVVRGRVVSRTGAPLAGIAVKAMRMTFEADWGTGSANEAAELGPVTTGADGAFEFRRLPKSEASLVASGETILFAGIALDARVDPLAVEIVAVRRVHLQVELAEPRTRADALRVLDGEARPMYLSEFRGASAHVDFAGRIEDGRSPVYSVGEDARTLVLTLAGAEVARLALAPQPAGVEVVRW